MMVLVDTPVWSLALRRHPQHLSAAQVHLIKVLTELIGEGRTQIVGPIRQELLSGIREEAQFQKIRESLHAFREPSLESADYEDAARMSNRCRSRGIAGSPIDFLICAAAHRRNWAILTTDGDFEIYAKVLPVRLHAVSDSREL
jgi:predicted nucleic acid-binding protein